MTNKDRNKQLKRRKRKEEHSAYLHRIYNKYGNLRLKQRPDIGSKYLEGLYEKLDKEDERKGL